MTHGILWTTSMLSNQLLHETERMTGLKTQRYVEICTKYMLKNDLIQGTGVWRLSVLVVEVLCRCEKM